METFDPVLRRDVHVTLAPILDRANTSEDRLVIVIEDISDRKQAELTLRRYTARMETVDDLEEAPVALHKAIDRVLAWL